jgi:hypothetical protein
MFLNIQGAAGVGATSRDSLHKIPKQKKQTLLDLVENVVRQAYARGVPNMSGKEIQDELQRMHGRFIEMSTLSGRIKSLIDMDRLTRDAVYTRPCRITGETISPVSAPPVQERIPGAY